MAEAIGAKLAKGVKKDANKLIIFGIITIVLGVLAMGSPMMAGMGVAVFVGFLMFIAGIFRTLFAFSAQSWGKGILAFVLGVLTIVAGIWLLARPLRCRSMESRHRNARFSSTGRSEWRASNSSDSTSIGRWPTIGGFLWRSSPSSWLLTG